MNLSPRDRWLALLREAIAQDTLVKLTLGAPAGPDPTLRKLMIRPVALREGKRLAFVSRHTSRDLTKNLSAAEALARIEGLLGREFQTAFLFTTTADAMLDVRDPARPRLKLSRPTHIAAETSTHDRVPVRLIEPGTPWLQSLGITTNKAQVCAGMEAKFRQLNKFVELLRHLLTGTSLATARPLRLVDMACGKGYLTFAAWDWLRHHGWPEAEVLGVEARPDLVEHCQRVAAEQGAAGLSFAGGTIASQDVTGANILVALHACDTATDDALAKGVEAGAGLILASPCCHKELRPQLVPPPVLAGALRHGILRERQAEFVTDALRAALLEWAGYETKVFEFISVEHTAKNLMIAATRRELPDGQDHKAKQVRELASFYGIRSQALATRLGFALS
jgi:hypothetical protein